MVWPTLWGPPLWKALFTCAHHCKKAADLELMKHVLEKALPEVLPCVNCRAHLKKNATKVTRRFKRVADCKTGDEVFTWLWHLKNTVNETIASEQHARQRAKLRTLPVSSLSLDHARLRYAFHEDAFDDVECGDVLVLVALDAEARGEDDAFLALCRMLGRLLPLPADSYALRCLRDGPQLHPSAPRRSVAHAFKIADGARCERGFARPPLSHYEKVVKMPS